MKAMRSLAATSALAITLASCGGGGGGSALPSGFNSGSSNAAPNAIANWGESQLQGASYVGAATNAHLQVNVLVHQQNATGLAQYAQDVSNPASGNYRQFLTPAQIASRFGASQSDYNTAAQYFASQGLAVGGWPQRMLLSVAGDQAHMQRAFGTTFGVYRRSGRTFVAPRSAPHFASAIPVDAIGHIVAWRSNHAYMVPGIPHAGAGYAVGYSPSVVRAGFDFSGAYSKGYNGAGITIGIIGTGPIDTGGTSGDVDLDALAAATNTTGNVAHVTERPVTASDVAAGLAVSGIPTAAPTGSPQPANGFPYSGDFQTPPPVTQQCDGNLPACNPEDGEAQLDTQQTATLAPGANVYFYLGYNASDCSTVLFPNSCAPGTGEPFIGIDEGDAEIQQAIAENVADVISISYGGGESQQGWSCYSGCSAPYVGSYSQLEFAAMATEGMAVFVSSGDSGSAECLAGNSGYLPEVCVSYPSGDPSVASVGGVTAPLDGFGNPTAPFLAWGISTFSSGYGATGGSGGGTSSLPIPATAWQSQFAGATDREQPDVSMIADPSTGVAFAQDVSFGGGIGDIGGTSVAAPEMAAMWAVVLSACKANPSAGACVHGSGSTPWRLGNATPYLYAIYNSNKTTNGTYGNFTATLPYNSVFYDILYGDNQMQNQSCSPTPGCFATPIPGTPAMTGYDEVTGVGTPYAGHLIQAITGVQVP
jgi:subtilase family serine protease